MVKFISFFFAVLLTLIAIPLIIIAFVCTLAALVLKALVFFLGLPTKALAAVADQIAVESNIINPKEDK